MRLMLIRPSQLDRDGQPLGAKKAWFDDLTLAHLAALTPAGVECTPVPGTVSWQKLKDQGRILTDDYACYDTVTAVFRPARMSARDLEEGQLYAYKRLYGIGASVRPLLPPLDDPVADLLATAMNVQYYRLARKGVLGAFNFN